MEIGKAIKHYRNKAKLTQKELAKKVNVSERTICHYETEAKK
jgi:DNA-binding XRE family transcriptional regulator